MSDASGYFDWAATAPADGEILRSALESALEFYGNPSSLHKAGSAARKRLEEARSRCARALAVPPDTVYFTSGGTEADCIPLASLLSSPSRGTVLVSAIEHPAVAEQAESLKKCGWRVEKVLPNPAGIVTAEAVAARLSADTRMVCVMAVNNETGAIQPIEEIADIIEEKSRGKRQVLFHVDCVQAAGKIPLDLNHAGITSAALSAHKICGPRGIGILYMKKKCEPFLRGGGQEGGIRSGTENLFGAEAFALCLEKYLAPALPAQKSATAEFIKKILEIEGCSLVPKARETAEYADSYSPYIVQASFRGIPGQVMLRALDEKGFCISTGSACSARKAGRPVLESMGISREEGESSVRFSFGPATRPDDMLLLAAAVRDVCAMFGG